MHRITVRNESGRRVRLSPVRLALEALLRLHHVPSCRIDVLVTTDEKMRELNLAHRGTDAATDVLSFPGPGWEGAPLGDVAVSLPFAEAGAARRKVPTGCELAFLAVHGALHLLGHNDENDAERAEMVRLMNEAMAAAGLPRDEGWASLPHEETTVANG